MGPIILHVHAHDCSGFSSLIGFTRIMTEKPKSSREVFVSSLLLWPLGGVAGLLLSSVGYRQIVQGLRITSGELVIPGIELSNIKRAVAVIQLVFPVDIFVIVFGKLTCTLYHALTTIYVFSIHFILPLQASEKSVERGSVYVPIGTIAVLFA